MNGKQAKDIAKGDLLAVAEVRHQLASARMARLAQAFYAAQQHANGIRAHLSALKEEVRLVREESVRAAIDNLSGLGLRQQMLRALDVDIRRAHVRLDMQIEQCNQLGQKLSMAKKMLAGSEIRVEFYKKARRQTLFLREEKRAQLDD